MYHQVGDFKNIREHRATYCNYKKFAAQMKMLKLLNYSVISIDDVLRGLAGEIQLSKHSVVLTFDDGYDNFREYALPLLKKYNFPAVVYAISGMLGKTATWLAESGHPTPPLLTEHQLRDLRDQGITIGSHAVNHIRLAEVGDLNIVKKEIVDSKGQLEKILGIPVEHFCYPYGSYNDAIACLVKEAGYRSATTCHRAYADHEADFHQLPRKAVSLGDSVLGLWWKLHMKG